MKKTAFLFPGQGSQAVGMGQDIYQEYGTARQRLDMAGEITGLPVTDLCFTGPMEELTRTVHLQPAVTAVNLAILSVISAEGIAPDYAAGHSLGEFSALCAAGITSDEDTLRLVHKRGELMHREATRHEGAMYALIGLPIDTVEELVRQGQAVGTVAVANHNAEKQIVITGSPDAVKSVADMAAGQKAKAIPLNVSGAWHSPLIQGAEDEFKSFLDTVDFQTPRLPVIHNVTAGTEDDPAAVRSLMARQLCSPVRWYDTVRKLVDEGVNVFAEIGPGKVLTGLVRKTLPKGYPCDIFSVGDRTGLEAFLQAAGK